MPRFYDKDAEVTREMLRLSEIERLKGEGKKGAFETAMGIDFTGAKRDPYDPIVPGWRVVNGRMVKDPTVLAPMKCKNAWARLLVEDY
jgi:hypothetical protein